MASSAQMRSKTTKKPIGSESKAPTPVFTPKRQLTRTPPPRANDPRAGTPINRTTTPAPPSTAPTPPSTNTSPLHETATEKTPYEKGLETLGKILKFMVQQFNTATEKINQGQHPDSTNIVMPYHTFEKMGSELQEAIAQIQDHKPTSVQIEEQFARLEKSLKETITAAATTRPWAPITPAAGPTRTREIQQQNTARKVQQRQEQAKLEVTLTTQKMNPDIKEQLKTQTHAEITTNLQQTIQSQMKENPILISGIEKLKSQDIRIQCNTEKEAEQLRELKWDELYSGLTAHQAKYGFLINGVPSESINPRELNNPELIKQLEYQNKETGLQITEMKTLRRKLGENTRHFSLVIFTTDKTIANKSLKTGIYFDNQHFPAHRYNPQFQVVQCFKCQKFGHHASKCRSLHEVCAKCSEHHPTATCQSETLRCAGCKQEHPAYHKDCPNKINEIQNMITQKRNAPAYFDD